jgi:bacteriocin-like protein
MKFQDDAIRDLTDEELENVSGGENVVVQVVKEVVKILSTASATPPSQADPGCRNLGINAGAPG